MKIKMVNITENILLLFSNIQINIQFFNFLSNFLMNHDEFQASLLSL